jgi:hypothetical protein
LTVTFGYCDVRAAGIANAIVTNDACLNLSLIILLSEEFIQDIQCIVTALESVAERYLFLRIEFWMDEEESDAVLQEVLEKMKSLSYSLEKKGDSIILTAGQDLSAKKELKLAIQKNGEFIDISQFDAFFAEQQHVIPLHWLAFVKSIALRNQLIQQLGIRAEEEMLVNPAWFHFQLFTYLRQHAAEIADPLVQLVSHYFRNYYADETNEERFSDSMTVQGQRFSYITMAIRTGMASIAQKIFEYYSRIGGGGRPDAILGYIGI